VISNAEGMIKNNILLTYTKKEHVSHHQRISHEHT